MDFVIINPGNTNDVYQSLYDLCAIEPPTFAALVANYLLERGFSGEIYDIVCSNETLEQAATNIVAKQPKIIAVFVYGYQPSASTQNMQSARQICQAIKELSAIPIIISGTHPAALPEQTLLEEPVDYVCDREGFETIEKLLLYYKNNTGMLEDIPSLWFKKDDHIVSTPTAGILNEKDLNQLVARPAWQLLDMSKYRCHNWHAFSTKTTQPYASMYTSLGCPYRCSFCCINAPFGKSSYRMWHPDTVIKQIDELVNKYGVRNIKFVDEMFVLNESHVIGICDRIIERGYDLNIWAYARVDATKDKFLDKLRRAGFRWLALGIESGSKHVRDGANKRYTNDDITDVVRRIQNHDIYVLGNFIFGLPDDTATSLEETFQMAEELNCEFVNFYCAMAYPGSRLYTMYKNLSNEWIRYSQHSYKCQPLGSEHLSSAEVLKFRDDAFIKYFSSEKYQSMIQQKFGDWALMNIRNMLKVQIKRELLENHV